MKNVALWIAQVLLAGAFVVSGSINTFAQDQALHSMNWIQILPSGLVFFIGICEFLGAAGLILPWLTGIKRQLTALAASGLGIIMFQAIGFHVAYGPTYMIGVNASLLSLCIFVAWGRWERAVASHRSG